LQQLFFADTFVALAVDGTSERSPSRDQ
jgi:hypothetical protein